jgi:hypothetical protein
MSDLPLVLATWASNSPIVEITPTFQLCYPMPAKSGCIELVEIGAFLTDLRLRLGSLRFLQDVPRSISIGLSQHQPQSRRCISIQHF